MHNVVATREYWDQAAKDDPYSTVCAGWTRDDCLTRQISLLFSTPVTKDMTIIDLGCGIGRIARWAAPRVKLYVGADWSEEMLRRAKEYNKDIPNVSFVHTDTLNCFKDVDLVLSEQLFFHLTREQQDRYLTESWEALRVGGQLVVSIPRSEYYVNGMRVLDFCQLGDGFDPCEIIPDDVLWVVRAVKV